MTARRNQEEANGLRGSGRKTMSNAPKNIRRARAGARPSEGLVDLHVTNTLLTTNTKWELTGITLLRRGLWERSNKDQHNKYRNQ